MTDTPTALPALLTRAAATGKKIICHRADGSPAARTYGDLLADARRVLGGLRGAGAVPGDPVVLQLEDNHDFLAAFWACQLGGLVAVPLAVPATGDGIAAARLRNVWELCGGPLVVGAADDVPAHPIGALRSHPPAESGPDPRPDDVFVILFTSGSTGTPKGVMLTHRNALAMIRRYTSLEGLTTGEVSFNWMPLDHVAGLLAFHVRDVYLGCAQVHAHPRTVLGSPLSWLDWLDHYRATVTWAPNFAYGMVNEALAAADGGHGWDLSPLRHILNAGEPIVPRTARRFLTLLAPYGLRPTAIRPSWGMSETSGGLTFSDRFSLETTSDDDRFTDVGPPIADAGIRVTRAGRVQVKGPTVTPGYYRNPALDSAAFTVDGWFDTGDLGTLAEGRLTITGRNKDVIIVNGVNHYAQEIEAVVEEVPGVEAACTAAVAVPAGDTEALAIFYCSRLTGEAELADQWDRIRRRVTAASGVNPAHLLRVTRADIPRTETGKIQREVLRRRLADGSYTAAETTRDEIERKLTVIWQRALGIERVGRHEDFYDLGGDSLSSMQIVALARDAGLAVTQIHFAESRTIAELAAALEERR
ncbi:non-ribosomal peptide synthetase [Streptosporangiaceae bacterium NEAU-GS5]|nr:non-ribosomal peptide synthetase [Streptosporangiaceae bacterium NEAU-GS5]